VAYQDFLESYASLKSATVDDIRKLGETQGNIRYLLNNRDRGAAYVPLLAKLYAKPIAGLRILDLGCAYGGICIELAKVGAKTTGIDVIPSYVGLARENAKGEVDTEFFVGDFTSKATLAMLGERKFDVFILNHVLEHIYDTVSLLENIAALASDDAAIVFDFPNGQSITSVRAEGHTGHFAASLAPPDCWFMFKAERARIYYRKWAYFTSLFERFGFGSIVRATPEAPVDRAAGLHKFIDEINVKRSTVPDGQKAIVDEVVTQYIAEIHYDLAHASTTDIDSKYFSYFWRGVAAKRDDIIPDTTRRMFAEAEWPT
jgi:2-polyprenyl-3-methyl-5-hydroxy-6-metoxy-1,4-benzoquinol methylase